jgi:hypothetical protein
VSFQLDQYEAWPVYRLIENDEVYWDDEEPVFELTPAEVEEYKEAKKHYETWQKRLEMEFQKLYPPSKGVK